MEKPGLSPAKTPVSHYDAAYFDWQNANSDIGAKINSQKFRELLAEVTGPVLDFGCGGGALLRALGARQTIGIEINPAAVGHARALGIEVHETLDDVPSESVQLIISNHALEHVEQPLTQLRSMYRVLMPGGKISIVVPCDRASVPFELGDRDFHLYSWSAGNIGNLARAAGFEVLSSRELVHRWPPRWPLVYRVAGPQLFDWLCVFWGWVRRGRTQVQVLAQKPR